jgi:translation elongation factor EF-Tu-like GTPase
MSYGPHIEGLVEFLPTEAGGRKGPAFSGYRPQFYYACHDWDARQEYPEVQQVNPGDTVRVIFTFVSPAEHWGKLYVGMPFLIREGARTVAYGQVTKILEALEHDAIGK